MDRSDAILSLLEQIADNTSRSQQVNQHVSYSAKSPTKSTTWTARELNKVSGIDKYAVQKNKWYDQALAKGDKEFQAYVKNKSKWSK